MCVLNQRNISNIDTYIAYRNIVNFIFLWTFHAPGEFEWERQSMSHEQVNFCSLINNKLTSSNSMLHPSVTRKTKKRAQRIMGTCSQKTFFFYLIGLWRWRIIILSYLYLFGIVHVCHCIKTFLLVITKKHDYLLVHAICAKQSKASSEHVTWVAMSFPFNLSLWNSTGRKCFKA